MFCLQSGDSEGDSLSKLMMLTQNLIVTANRSDLVVWDSRLPEPVKIVRLACQARPAAGVHILQHCQDTVVCSVGNQIRLIRFPVLATKMD